MTSPPSRHQRRRHARQLRRDGYQPMAILGAGDRLQATAAALIGRIIWRYRSELTPLILAALITLTAVALHHTHSRAWPWPAITVLAGTTALTVPPPSWLRNAWSLLDRPLERIYAAAVTLIAGGWLTAAIAVGPATAPMPLLGGILTVITAIPWWASARRRAKVRVERKLDAWPDIARATGLAGSEVMSAVVDAWGWRALLRLARGQTITDVIGKIPALESSLAVFRGALRIYPTADDMANKCELRVLDTDPHADAIPWPGPSVTSITQPIDLGPFEDADPCRVLLLRRHVIIGGSTGWGKSGGLNVLMGNLTACRDVVIWAIDLKRGMELKPWASCIGRLATTPQQAAALLRDAVAVIEARAELLAATGRRTWEPSPDLPALVIITDEYAELTSYAPDALPHADSITRLGRAVAVTLIPATQRPTQKAMGQGAVRSQMNIRICFRVEERRDVDLILGQGKLNTGWHAHTLNAPGKFLISSPEHNTPRRARAYHLTDEVVTQTAAQHATIRPELDEISRRAARQATDPGDSPPPVSADMQTGAMADSSVSGRHQDTPADSDPEAVLLAALARASRDGISVTGLVSLTGMSRRWVYYRLRKLAAAGRAIQTNRGLWHATTSPEGDNE